MSPKNVQNDTCRKCKKAWLTYHTFKEFKEDGRPGVMCHDDPLPSPDLGLKYILDLRSDILEAQAVLVELKKQASLDKQASEAELERKFNSNVEAEANKKLTESIVEIEADHKKELDEGEKTRVHLVSSHDAKVNHLEDLLKEVRGDRQILREEKTAIAKKLTDSEQKSVDLQLQLDDLTESYDDLKGRHKGLKDRGLDMVRTLISMGTRVAVLEEKTGVIPKIDPKRIYAIVMEQKYDDEEIPADELPSDPTPVPPPAPKADVETAPMSAKETVIGSVGAAHKVDANTPLDRCVHPGTKASEAFVMAAATPVQPTNTAVMDDLEPESESSASADDDDDGQDHDDDVDDDAVVEQLDAASDEDDEESSEKKEPVECRVCDKPATQEMTFVQKDGNKDTLTACDPSAHADVFLDHLKQEAKRSPENAMDVIALFNPIQ